MVYGLLVLNAVIPASGQVFNLVAVTIVLSIVLHSSSDILVARWFDDEREVPAWHHTARRIRGRLSRPRARQEPAE